MKQCIICGQDCSSRARVKDAQGRYACQSCVEAGTKPAEAARATVGVKSARRAVAAGVTDASHGSPAMGSEPELDLSSLAQAESAAVGMAVSRACPSCSRIAPTGAIECPGCGTNLETGKQRKQPKEAKEHKPFNMPKLPFELSAGMMAAIAFSVLLVFLMCGKFVSPGFYLAFLLAWGVYTLVFLIAVVIVPFFEDQKIWGVVNGVAMFFGIGVLLPVWYVLMYTEAEWLKYMAGISILTMIGFLAVGGHKELEGWNPNGNVQQTAPSGVGPAGANPP